MPSNPSSGDRLVPSHPCHVLSTAPTSFQNLAHYQSEHRLRRGRPTAQHLRELPLLRSGIGSYPENENDNDDDLSIEHSWSATRWTGPLPVSGTPDDAAFPRLPPLRGTDSVARIQRSNSMQGSIVERNPKEVEQRHSYQGGNDGVPTPPTTPQIHRLKTPDLGPVEKCDRFCSCCPDCEQYQEGRAKMDAQRRYSDSQWWWEW